MKRILCAATFMAATLLCGADIYLAGDSTVCDYKENKAPMTGWGQALRKYVQPGVKVHNRAVGGRSTKSFQDEKRWEKLVNDLKPGDFVFIQFGHNDQKEDKPAVYAAADTDYRSNLEKFITEVRAKGGSVILCTPVQRRRFDKETNAFQETLGQYPKVVREVGKATDTPVIDLTAWTGELFRKEGVEGTVKYLTILKKGESENYPKGVTDNTHYSAFGADAVAQEVVREAQKQQLPVGKLFIEVK